MKRDQSLSPLVIILLILITFPLDNVWRLLRENSCWSLFGHKSNCETSLVLLFLVSKLTNVFPRNIGSVLQPYQQIIIIINIIIIIIIIIIITIIIIMCLTLFQTHHHTLPYAKQRKIIKFKPRIKFIEPFCIYLFFI